ncbi:SDR family oxidoreductase [Amycolatopsis thermophila]|uniref:NAD(P)-dependent dehydrogenase (Short-subunit alcohol dehydrogenase family) n=1 Tax=Amycolatopsis thermophila TaxID=206084 RepID=A0ABU0F560_9PSEU|nr:SDR family oxidoreductase [Amycolatopsis thermophila]MDQ0382726.1 NAD(P)-dependent dehydrogenase (short-subunit alcohol dehydrogenase family) [Amycolatopsis thermophila]
MADALKGQVAIVTGGGTGLGRGIAVELAKEGAHVVVASRGLEHLKDGVAAIEQAGGSASAHQVDIRDADAVQAMVDATVRDHGRLDILVNNAAGNFVLPAEEYTPNGWRTIVDIVVNGTFLCSWAAGRHWIEAKHPGAILNVVSTHIYSGCPGLAASAASKAAVANLTQTLAVEWGAHGIRVNGLAPGIFPNPTVQAQMHPEESIEDAYARAAKVVPLGRAGEVWELGRAAVFLCGPDGAYVSGHTLVMDGANWLRRGHLTPEYKTVPQQIAERGMPTREKR